MLAEHDRDVSHAGHEAYHVSKNIGGAIEVALSARVQLRVIRGVVVALRKQMEVVHTIYREKSWSARFSSNHTNNLSSFHFRAGQPISHGGSNSPSAVRPDHAMDDRNVLALDLVHDNVSHARRVASIPKEEQVAALEGRLHGAGQHDDDGARRVGHDAQTLPHHERSAHDEGEVEQLRRQAARVHARAHVWYKGAEDR